VVFGQTSPFGAVVELSALDGTDGFVLNGVDADDWSGASVSGAGDVNDDSIDDVIIGAPFADPNGPFSGESYVVYGHTGPFAAAFELSDLDGTNGFVLNGVAAGDFAGAVSGAGDVNDDGIADVIVGASGADPNGESSGASYVVFGEPGEPLAVELAEFGARRIGDSVLLEWRTLTELHHAGFRVLREEADGTMRVVTSQLIPPRSHGGELAGADYRFVDRLAPADAVRYWLEDVDGHGKISRHGPIELPARPAR
jgi:hypothetical protein